MLGIARSSVQSYLWVANIYALVPSGYCVVMDGCVIPLNVGRKLCPCTHSLTEVREGH